MLQQTGTIRSSGLFHTDNAAIFDFVGLRNEARKEVRTSSLICRAASGDRRAAEALHIGFWPFVHEFEVAIDHHALDRRPLTKRFGAEQMMQTFRHLAAEVRGMKEEEGVHSKHWKKDASELGITDLTSAIVPAGVQRLVQGAYTPDHVQFFSILAGTEFIAEELGNFLVPQKPYTDLFERERWIWGEVHRIPHDDGPSHLEIDMDFARAYAPEGSKEIVEGYVLEAIRMFGAAARDVEAAFAS